MSEGTTKVQDNKTCKLPAKAVSEPTDEGKREERTCVKAQQKPSCKKVTNNDVLGSSSKDNLRKPKSMGYTDLKRRNDELVLEVQLFESRSKEMEKQHMDTINKLLQEIQQWKEITLNAEREIASYKDIIREKETLLCTVQEQLSEVRAENKQLVTILEAAQIDAVTGDKLEKSKAHQVAELEAEAQVALHEQKLDCVISELDKCVAVLEEQKKKLCWNTQLLN